MAIFQGHKSIDRLPRQFILDTDDGRLGYRMMLDQGSFDLGGGQAVTRYVDNVVNATSNPVVAFMVAASSVASELHS